MILLGNYRLIQIVLAIGEWKTHQVKKVKITGEFLVLVQIMLVIEMIDFGGDGLLHLTIVMSPVMV